MEYLMATGAAIFLYCLFKIGLERKNSDKNLIRKRLQSIKKIRRYQTDQEEETIGRWRLNLSWIRIPATLERDLTISEIKISPREFVALWGMAVLILPLLLLLLRMGLMFCFAAAIAGALLPPLLIREKRKKRIKKFQNQLGEALLILSNTIRAGVTFERALIAIAEGLPEPISEELLRVGSEIQVGTPIEAAMDEFAERMQSEDLGLLTSAILIQKRVGGNLADIMEIISETVKDRIKIKGKIKTLAAQGKVSALVVGIMPIALVSAISMVTQDYMMPLFTTAMGIMMLVCAVVLEVIGFFIMIKMTDIKA